MKICYLQFSSSQKIYKYLLRNEAQINLKQIELPCLVQLWDEPQLHGDVVRLLEIKHTETLDPIISSYLEVESMYQFVSKKIPLFFLEKLKKQNKIKEEKYGN